MEARRNRPGPRPARRAWRAALTVLLGALLLTSCGEAEVPPPEPSPSPVATATATPSTPSAEALLDEAYVLLRAGRYDEAAAGFAAAAEHAASPPLLSTARLGEAVAVYETGQVGRALSLLRLAFAAADHGTPEEARAVYLLGVRLNENRAYEEAVALLRPHAVLGSGLALAPSIVSEYARALAGRGDVERAEAVWASLLATPGLGLQLRLPILRQRADLARVDGDLEGRRRWLGELAAVTGDPAVRHELAAVGFLLGDLDLFEAQLRAIVVETPWANEAPLAVRDLRDAGYEVDLGEEGLVYYRHRAFAEARAVLTLAVAEAGLPGDVLAFRTYFLAASYDDEGYHLESVPLYDAVSANPEAGIYAHRARFWAARALENAGRYREAAWRYDVVAREAGGEFVAEAVFRSGLARLRAGDIVGAVAAWRAREVREARTHYWLGRALADSGDTEGARRAWLEALAVQPQAFHGLEARRALDLDVADDGSYRPLAPPPAINWDALAAWLATHRPGSLVEAAVEAPELALVGLRGRAAEAIAYAAARTGNPWTLLSLARTATEANLPQHASAIAERLQVILDITSEDMPDDLVRLRYPLPYPALLEEYGEANDLDPLLLAALIHQESRWNATAVSVAGAAGLTQVIPTTAAWIADRLGRRDVAPGELFRPAVSVEFGAHYLAVQLREFGDVHQALAAYNGGPGNVERWAAVASWPPADFVEAIAFRETRAYVQLVMEHYAWYRTLYGGTGG